jgi:hypothetical protein
MTLVKMSALGVERDCFRQKQLIPSLVEFADAVPLLQRTERTFSAMILGCGD